MRNRRNTANATTTSRWANGRSTNHLGLIRPSDARGDRPPCAEEQAAAAEQHTNGGCKESGEDVAADRWSILGEPCDPNR
jgi:hypothetical protein